ncbi:hypothetical protein DPX16_0399 [Anabarilius grahami]|uniref:Uncharacterized protein n=1 Tax=Anabarilius grahami TaxID=495550 RepID=A0A3N0XZ06_ANAGA|nr:hypothetical protein DPX16_0399 [Anabarilius grahami]
MVLMVIHWESLDAESADPLFPDWIPSVFSRTPATKRKREKDMVKGYERHNRMKNMRVEKQKQDVTDVILELSSVPDAEDEQQYDTDNARTS